ncbi:MAG TPA: NAD-dependent epimerase/dehydratase family protein [Nitrospiria bacterium]|nr:NAD-dependent epimerase/dehydratase family protein [Nitrospiria bacterium]
MNVVTGGLSYIGKYITRRLVANERQVRILTGHLNRPNPFGNQVSILPINFDNDQELIKNLQGAETLYNTYWVRFDHGNVSFNKAVENTKRLIRAAEAAGVRKLVHLSVSNPSEDSPYPYFRGKAILEKIIAQSKLPYAIIRPTLVYGGEEEILVSNITWLLRRFPIFAVPSRGTYRVQPIFVDDLAEMAVNAVQNANNKIIDAADPETFTFEEMIRLIKNKIKSRSILFHASPGLSLFLLKIVGIMMNDVVLTPDELGALMDNLLVSKNPPAGKTRLSDWLDRNGDKLDRRYANEMIRHFR